MKINIPYNFQVEPNPSLWQRRALTKFCKNMDNVISKADKGSIVLIQNRSDYISEAMTHLNNTSTYKLLTGDSTQHVCNQIHNILHDYYKKCYFTKNMYTFCLPPKHARLTKIYFLKKIHWAFIPLSPDVRIQVSANSLTIGSNHTLDCYIPSYLKDMNQFILEIKQLVIPPNSTMVAVAVKSLYTNIPHDEGINSILRSNPQKPLAEIFVDLFLKTTLLNSTAKVSNNFTWLWELN